MLLAKPYRLVMPFRNHSFSIEIQGAVEGEIQADVNGDGQLETIPCVRVFGRRLDKPSRIAYWDITCRQPSTMLEAFLRSGSLIGKSVTFSVIGRGAMRRDTITIKAIGAK